MGNYTIERDREKRLKCGMIFKTLEGERYLCLENDFSIEYFEAYFKAIMIDHILLRYYDDYQNDCKNKKKKFNHMEFISELEYDFKEKIETIKSSRIRWCLK